MQKFQERDVIQARVPLKLAPSYESTVIAMGGRSMTAALCGGC